MTKTALPRIALSALVAAGVLVAAAAPAAAETVRGTLTYTDGDGSINPIRYAKVEVHRWGPRWGGGWFWQHETTAWTDGTGAFTTSIPYLAVGTVTGLRVFATNEAAQVMTQDFLIPFYRQPGLPGTEIQRTTYGPSDVLSFDYNFHDDWARTHFNIADAILNAYYYARARRDPAETDVINRVDVHFNSVTTYYDPILHAVRLTPYYALDDYTVIHEYTHYLEEQIGSFYGIASYHDGCIATVGVVDVRGPGLAWMEGFASYLPLAVARAMPGMVDGDFRGSLHRDSVESPWCAGVNWTNAHATEIYVAAALADLTDGVGNEFFDELSDRDTEVFQIFDRELDLGWTNPTLHQFVNAWLARGLDAPQFLAALAANSIYPPSTPATVIHYDTAPAANFAIFRPGSGQWWILGSTQPVTVLGAAGDQPLPADYDGDGLTDLAVWRSSTAQWLVKKSTGGAVVTTAQGQPGDLAVPADYDGDGEVDFALYRPTTGQLLVHGDTAAERRTMSTFWVADARPVAADVNGDGKPESGIYDPASGWFYLRPVFGSGSYTIVRVGDGGDTPVVRDYDGDNRDDLAVYDGATGNFIVRYSGSGMTATIWWGVPGELPAPADFDGNPGAELATWDPYSGMWYVRRPDGSMLTQQWGVYGDITAAAR